MIEQAGTRCLDIGLRQQVKGSRGEQGSGGAEKHVARSPTLTESY
jgi:hypothetical protein